MSSPQIQSAFDIGYAAQMYIVQGDYDIAYQKYESSLSILIPQLKEFPPGFKKDLLLHYVRNVVFSFSFFFFALPCKELLVTYILCC